MYEVSNKLYANKIVSDDRTFAVKLTFGSSTELTGATIQDITLDEIINSAESLTMGCACSNKVTVNLIDPPTNFAYDGAAFKVKVGLKVANTGSDDDYEWVPLGTFYGTVAETKNDFKTLKLTAYDGFCKMTGKYIAGEDVLPKTDLQTVYNDLKTQLQKNCGITLKERTLPNYVIPNFPYLDITYAQAIGYVAGCLGENARFDRNGELEMVWYTDSEQSIPRSLQYMDGFARKTEDSLTITSVATGTKDVPIVYGSGTNGTEINFENPYITQQMAKAIYDAVEYKLIYTPCSVKWRGNPAIQAGDIIKVSDKDGVDHNVLVMSQSLKVGGGCSATIECKGTSATKSAFSTNFESVGQKIERMYSALEKSILDATNAITGNKGGYVKLLDGNGDGAPDEIVISDSPILESDNPEETAKSVWRWNNAGLGYSYNPAGNAYRGPYRTAITQDGQINADFITTGTLNAERIAVGSYDVTGKLTEYIRFGDGYMEFGKTDNKLILKLDNDEIVFLKKETNTSGKEEEIPVARFSNNSFEIENLSDGGQIRFQNFGFVTRGSGNLTFTKLK